MLQPPPNSPVDIRSLCRTTRALADPDEDSYSGEFVPLARATQSRLVVTSLHCHTNQKVWWLMELESCHQQDCLATAEFEWLPKRALREAQDEIQKAPLTVYNSA